MRRAALIALIITGGCAPATSMGRARTLPAGTSELSAGLEAGLVRPNQTDMSDPRLPWMNLGIGYRRGVASRVDMAGHAWVFGIPALYTWGVGVDTKVQLVASSDPGRGWDLATGALVAYQQVRNGGTPWHAASVAVPLLAGWNLGRHQLVFGPRVGYTYVGAEGQYPIHAWTAGASVAFAWRFGQRWELVPELTTLYSPLHFGGEVGEHTGAPALQLTIALTRHL